MAGNGGTVTRGSMKNRAEKELFVVVVVVDSFEGSICEIRKFCGLFPGTCGLNLCGDSYMMSIKLLFSFKIERCSER